MSAFTPLNIYNGTLLSVPKDVKGQPLPINQLKCKPLMAGCPILNVHRFNRELELDNENDHNVDNYDHPDEEDYEIRVKLPLSKWLPRFDDDLYDPYYDTDEETKEVAVTAEVAVAEVAVAVLDEFVDFDDITENPYPEDEDDDKEYTGEDMYQYFDEEEKYECYKQERMNYDRY